MPRSLSVVIPHYGEAAPTLALVSQLQQQVDITPQIIVVDDCSPVAFPAVLDGVDVVRRSANGGFGSAVNSGVRRATSELILIVNSDVTMPEDFLVELLERAEEFLPAVVAPRVEESWGERIMGRHWPTAYGMMLEALVPAYRLSGISWYERTLGNDTRSVRSQEGTVVDWAVGICLLIPTKQFRAVGGFDERFYMNCEEIDLQRRLHEEQGLDVVVLPAPQLSHVGGGSSDSARRAGWLMDARMRYYAKWHGTPNLVIALSSAALINFAWQSARRIIGRDVDPIRRLKSEFRLIVHAWKSRK